jgi:hypothetical protein
MTELAIIQQQRAARPHGNQHFLAPVRQYVGRFFCRIKIVDLDTR